MCRLMALSKESGGFDTPSQFILGTMLVASTRLGNTHGMGISAARPGHDSWFKSGASAENIVFYDQWRDWFNEICEGGIQTIAGHTRLASAAWRVKADEKYPLEDAHPFVCGDIVGMHNGIFKGHEELAKTFGLKNYTDTMAFYTFLASEVGDGDLTPDKVVEALKQVGEADYSLIMRNVHSDTFLVFRGDRDLYAADSNYGLLLNTARANLTDLEDAVNLALRAWDYPELKIEMPTYLPKYTAYTLHEGTLTKVLDFGEVEAINKPTKVTVVRQGAGYWEDNAANNNNHSTVVSAAEVALRVEIVREIVGGDLKHVPEEHIRLTLKELCGNDLETLAFYDSEQLAYLLDVLTFAVESHPELHFTKQKQRMWVSFAESCWEAGGSLTTEDVYTQACTILGKDFDVPYWHNLESDMLELLASI